MKTFKSYILEKLVIDNDVKIEPIKRYDVGDIILMISYWKNDDECAMALTKIDEIDTEEKIIYTRTDGANYRGHLNYSKTDVNYKYIAVNDSRGIPYVFIPENNVLDILKTIHDNGNKIDSSLFNNPNVNNKKPINVSFMYDSYIKEFKELVANK